MVKYITVFLLSLIFGVFILFSIFPKFILLDKLLMENGVFLTADSVKEGFFDIELKNTNIYTQNKLIIKNSDISLKISLTGLKFTLSCEGKTSYLNIQLSKDFQGEFNSFMCLTVASEVDGKIYTKEGIHGKLTLKGIQAQGRKIDSVEFDFKGKNFFFKAVVDGLNIDGSGNVDYNKDNPLNSKINAIASSLGFNITISGTLLNPQINLR